MTRKHRTPKPKSFMEDIRDTLRKDPAIAPFAELIEDFFETGATPGGIYLEPFDSSPDVIMQIPPPMYRKLLMLCHPDKHNNSETATEVTKWLLEQRSMYDDK